MWLDSSFAFTMSGWGCQSVVSNLIISSKVWEGDFNSGTCNQASITRENYTDSCWSFCCRTTLQQSYYEGLYTHYYLILLNCCCCCFCFCFLFFFYSKACKLRTILVHVSDQLTVSRLKLFPYSRLLPTLTVKLWILLFIIYGVITYCNNMGLTYVL